MHKVRGPEGMYCPFWKKTMDKVCHTCPMWTEIQSKGQGETVTTYGCALSLGPALSTEIARQQLGIAAAMEGLRNVIAMGVAHSKIARMAEQAAPHLLDFDGKAD